MLDLRILPVGEYQSNCFLLADSSRQIAILIDPGDQAEEIIRWAGTIKVQEILITHGHHDHVGALKGIRQAFGASIYIHAADAELYEIEADFAIHAGARLNLGADYLEFVHIPGHTPGSVGFKIIESEMFKRAIVGDAIFPGGPGHTESPEAFVRSIKSLSETVFTWPDNVILYPGHGDATTVGLEREAFEGFCSKPIPPDLYGDVNWS
jgi:hydroxyacylglutathione hydrolase